VSIEKFKCHRNEHLPSITKFKALGDNEVQVNSRKGDRTSDDIRTSQVTDRRQDPVLSTSSSHRSLKSSNRIAREKAAMRESSQFRGISVSLQQSIQVHIPLELRFSREGSSAGIAVNRIKYILFPVSESGTVETGRLSYGF
jgi:hypothetical protein